MDPEEEEQQTREEIRRQRQFEEAEKELMTAIRKICRKAPQELNEENVKFLRARRSYLTGDQLKKFEDVLADKDNKGIKEYQEFKKKAEELGIPITKGMKLEEIKELILQNS